MLLSLLVLCLVIWTIISRWNKRGMHKLWNQQKNKYWNLPFIGHAYLFIGDDEDRMKVFQKLGIEAYETGGLLTMWQGSRLYVNISDPAIAEIVLKACLEKDDVVNCSRLLIGNGSIFAPVSIWRPRRKVLAPTFSPKNLMQFAQVFIRQSSVLVHQLRNQAGKGTFSIWKYIATYSMDSACESTLGVQVKTQFQPTQPFLSAFDNILKIDGSRYCKPWFYNDNVFKMTPDYKEHTKHKATICKFIDKIIKGKRLELEEEKNALADKAESEQCTHKNLKTFLELLIESSGGDSGYSDLELQEETLVLVLAATDTTAVGTSFASLMLALHPEVQEKVYQEIQAIFGDSNRPVSFEDLPRLTYLDAVVRETLRLYPSVPVIVRKVTKDVTLPSGLTLPTDCGLLINIWAIHRNPKYWGEDAMEFRPERFLEPLKHPAAFMAFSHGPRACLGYQYAMMSMKTALSTMIRHYRVLTPATTGSAGAGTGNLRVKFDVMLKHVDNFELQLEARQTIKL